MEQKKRQQKYIGADRIPILNVRVWQKGLTKQKRISILTAIQNHKT